MNYRWTLSQIHDWLVLFILVRNSTSVWTNNIHPANCWFISSAHKLVFRKGGYSSARNTGHVESSSAYKFEILGSRLIDFQAIEMDDNEGKHETRFSESSRWRPNWTRTKLCAMDIWSSYLSRHEILTGVFLSLPPNFESSLPKSVTRCCWQLDSIGRIHCFAQYATA